MSDNKAEIWLELRRAQLELKAPKGQYNSFAKYHYRSAEDIVEAAKPVLNRHGLTLVVSDTIELIGDRFYVKATAELYNEIGQVMFARGYAREDEDKKGMDGAQITGAASSYARKYALNGLLAIDDTKDADSQDNRSTAPMTGSKPAAGKAKAPTTKTVPASAPATSLQKKRITAFLRSQGVQDADIEGVLKEDYGIAEPKAMTAAQARQTLEAMEATS